MPAAFLEGLAAGRLSASATKRVNVRCMGVILLSRRAEHRGYPGRLRPIIDVCRIPGMDRDRVIAKLREHEPELRAAGIVHLRLHGSVDAAKHVRLRMLI